MAWKDLIVFADGSADGVARVKMAAELAKVAGAHLEAHTFVETPRRLMTMAAGALADAYQEALVAAAREGDRAVEAMKAAGPGLGDRFSTYRQDAPHGDLRRVAGNVARAGDVAILGRPESTDGSDIDSQTLLGALFGSGRPCLVLPRWAKPRSWGKRAVVAWKGTPEAARAVAAAIPLLARAESVRVTLVDPRGEAHGEHGRALARVETHLLRHGVPVEGAAVRRSNYDRVWEAIYSDIESFGADLLVMGAFGHSRFQQMVFGGMTREALAEAKLPLLMAH